MTFRSDLDSDFQDILAGDFAARIVFSPDNNEWDTTGIFDNSYEPIETNEQGQTIAAKYSRVTIWYKDAPIEIEHGTLVDVYRDPESDEVEHWRVDDIQDDSEGNALLVLRKL